MNRSTPRSPTTPDMSAHRSSSTPQMSAHRSSSTRRPSSSSAAATPKLTKAEAEAMAGRLRAKTARYQALHEANRRGGRSPASMRTKVKKSSSRMKEDHGGLGGAGQCGRSESASTTWEFFTAAAAAAAAAAAHSRPSAREPCLPPRNRR
ncbi:unnamed protein product [Zymoseptoria tritici ST99CH_1A5]|uniref:Uncharacterized protein n=1 Tax=Zymoseptoria tritici ST99CH_1A5 TaxID=1276529 RepID=A0A1Y6M1B9_ZYMTR|nr:unnamed protein product [Zymoseptoria tritici ST99CH_1A5]